MNATPNTAAAHIITADAVAMGDPEIIIMTRDEGMGAEEIERQGIDGTASRDAIHTLMEKVMEWRVVGEPTEVETGYYIVDVERA